MHTSHRLTQILAASALVMTVFAGRSSAQTPASPQLDKVTVQNVVLNRGASEIALDVVNATGQEITAYAIDILVNGDPNTTISRDKYLSSELSAFTGKPSETIGPGQTATIRLPYTFPADASAVTVRVSALVLADGTTAGHQVVLDAIMAGREDTRQTLAEFVPQLKEAATAGLGAAGVRQIVAKLPAPVPNRTSAALILRADLQALAKSMDASPARAADLLRQAVELYERQLAAATKHTKR
jgi:hypothetical protein